MEKAPAAPATRERFEGEADFRARERNKYRSVWQKMFGRDKSDSMDVIMEEAIAMNAAIDKELKDGRAQDITEALDSVDQMPQFQMKGGERVKVEEYARAKTLQVGEAIESNDFYKASSILYREQNKKGVDKETAQVMDERTTAFVKQHVAGLAEAKDGKNLVKAVTAFDSRLDKSDISPEAAKSPEIQKAVSENLISYFRAFSVSEPKVFVGQMERFDKVGLVVEREKIVQAPEVKKFATEKAISYFRAFGHSDPKVFQKLRDTFVELGVGSVEDFTQLPEIKEQAKEKAISYFRAFGHSDLKVFQRLRDDFIALGVGSAEEFSELFEIKEQAREKAINYFRAFGATDPKVFQRLRDDFVALGIGTVEDYNGLPEIQEMARERVASYQRAFGATQPEVIRKLRDSFIQLGINLVGEVG